MTPQDPHTPKRPSTAPAGDPLAIAKVAHPFDRAEQMFALYGPAGTAAIAADPQAAQHERILRAAALREEERRAFTAPAASDQR